MPAQTKPTIPFDTFAAADIRLGRILTCEPAENAAKPSYKITADFGKYGIRTSVGRFTRHAAEDLIGRQIFGVLNFEPRDIGGTISEFLTLGVQWPNADHGEATLITPMVEAKLGSKLF
jgi:tRNA-binding protein